MTNEEIAAAIRAELPPMSDHPPYEGSPRAKLLALADKLDPPTPPPVLEGCLWDVEEGCWVYTDAHSSLFWQTVLPDGLWIDHDGGADLPNVGILHVWPPPPTLSMDYDDALKLVLDEHAKWLAAGNTGRQLDLNGADLRHTNLRNANLRNANLRNANLSGAVRPEGWPS